MQVDGLSSINRRLRPYGLKLNIAHYLSEPRVDLCRSDLQKGQAPALVGVKIGPNGVLSFGLRYLCSAEPGGRSVLSMSDFLTDTEIDNWLQRLSGLRELCRELNTENHVVTF